MQVVDVGTSQAMLWIFGLLLNCMLFVCLFLFFSSIFFAMSLVNAREEVRHYKESMKRFQILYDEIKDIMDNHECCPCDATVQETPPEAPGEDESNWWKEGDDKPYGEAA